MSENKLHIEVAGHVLDVEGDATLVKEVYEDFKQQLAVSETNAVSPQVADQSPPDPVITAPVSSPVPPANSFAGESARRDPIRSDVAPIIKIAENLELEKADKA